MRHIWTIMVIVSFLSVLTGSFVAMAYSEGMGRSFCLATRLNGSEAPCPESDPLGFAGFHGSALRSFSNLIVVDGSALLFMLALLSAALFRLFPAGHPEKELLREVITSFADLKSKSYTLRSDKLDWFSIHENSPAYFGAMN